MGSISILVGFRSNLFSCMSNLLTVSAKKVLKVSDIILSSDIISPDSTRVIFADKVPFSDRKGLTVFQRT